MKIYLAGPIFGCTDFEAIAWRLWVKARLPEHEFLDPMDRDYRGRQDEHFQQIVEDDLLDIRSADLVFVKADKPSWGTAMELWDASSYGVPILVVCPHPVNPWLRYVATRLAHSMTGAIDAVRNWEQYQK